ncbi:MAG TPA: hypothetical protein VF765_11630 [Polyangiaceae bacterium]
MVPLAVPFLLAGCAGNTQQAPSPSTFAHDAHVNGEIVAAGGSVYWVDRGSDVVDSIHAMPAAGGSDATVYTAPSGASPAIEDLASDGANLYWLEVTFASGKYHSQVKAMPLHDGSASVLADANTALFLVAVNGSFVYFSEVDSLVRIPVGGGAAQTVTSSSTIASWAMAASSTGACWAAPGTGTVSCEPAGSSAPVTIATNQSNVQAVAVAGSNVYWSTVDSPEQPAHASIFAAPIAGGTARLLTSDATDPVALAADANAVYFIDQTASTASLAKVSTGAGDVSTLASGFSPADPSIVSAVHIALGDTSVYWTDATQGLVLSTAK